MRLLPLLDWHGPDFMLYAFNKGIKHYLWWYVLPGELRCKSFSGKSVLFWLLQKVEAKVKELNLSWHAFPRGHVERQGAWNRERRKPKKVLSNWLFLCTTDWPVIQDYSLMVCMNSILCWGRGKWVFYPVPLIFYWLKCHPTGSSLQWTYQGCTCLVWPMACCAWVW
jgi:hypothetical protein